MLSIEVCNWRCLRAGLEATDDHGRTRSRHRHETAGREVLTPDKSSVTHLTCSAVKVDHSAKTTSTVEVSDLGVARHRGGTTCLETEVSFVYFYVDCIDPDGAADLQHPFTVDLPVSL